MQYVIIGLLLNSEAAVSKCLLANCSCTVHHSSMKTSENINKFIKWTLQCKFKFKSTSGHILHSASQHDNLAILFFFWLLLPSSVETLTLEDVVHCTDCKAHWGTVIMTFGYIDKLIWLFLPTILFCANTNIWMRDAAMTDDGAFKCKYLFFVLQNDTLNKVLQ